MPVRVDLGLKSLSEFYLSLLGFTHSAFALSSEGALQQSPCFNKHIPRGELIELLGKALLYLEVESHWRDDTMTTNCKNKFSLLEHHVCSGESSSSTAPLKSPVVSSIVLRPVPSSKSSANGTLLSNQDISQNPQILSMSSETLYSTTPSVRINGSLTTGDNAAKRKVSPIQINGPKEKRAKHESDDMEVDAPAQKDAQLASKGISVQPYASHSSRPTQDLGTGAPKRAHKRITQVSVNDAANSKAVMMLPGHRTEVFVCAFNPTKRAQLATGYGQIFIPKLSSQFLRMSRSRDAVVNLWNLPEPPASKDEFATWSGNPITIDNHQKDVQGDLTALNWDREGKLVAVGSYDSALRILTSEGNVYFTHYQHRVGPLLNILLMLTHPLRLGSCLLGAVLSKWAVVGISQPR